MFALVLQKMVTTIHTDEACAGLLQNAWYLDDGSIAGESSSVLRALTIIQAQGPSLGFYVNLKKCELFSVSDLSSFPPLFSNSTGPASKLSQEHRNQCTQQRNGEHLCQTSPLSSK